MQDAAFILGAVVVGLVTSIVGTLIGQLCFNVSQHSLLDYSISITSAAVGLAAWGLIFSWGAK